MVDTLLVDYSYFDGEPLVQYADSGYLQHLVVVSLVEDEDVAIAFSREMVDQLVAYYDEVEREHNG